MATKNTNGDMPNAHLHELFVDELRDMLGAEKQLTKGLKLMAQSANSQELKDAFQTHLEETQQQVEILKKVFESVGINARAKKCKAMEGLLNEAEEIIESFEDEAVLDAALISAAQKVEHYEIASYGCLVTYATLMEHEEAVQLLGQILDQEKSTDQKLTDIAMTSANVTA